MIYLASTLAVLWLAYRSPGEISAAAHRQSHWPDKHVTAAAAITGLIYGIYNVGLVTILAYGPLMLAERGWTFAAASSVTSLVLWVVTISLPLGGVLADRTGRRATVLVGGLLAYAATMALAPRADEAVVLTFLALGIASGLPCGAIMSLPTPALRPETRAVGMGVLFSVYYTMNVCGPWLVGLLAERAGSAQFAFDVTAISILIAIALWVVFRQLAGPRLAEKRLMP